MQRNTPARIDDNKNTGPQHEGRHEAANRKKYKGRRNTAPKHNPNQERPQKKKNIRKPKNKKKERKMLEKAAEQ